MPSSTVPSGLRLPSISVAERVHHDGHLLLWQCSGASDLTLDGRAQVLRAGYVTFVPAGVRHVVHVRAGSVVVPALLRLGLSADHLPSGLTHAVDAALTEMLLALVQHESDLLRTGKDVQALAADHLAARRVDVGAPPLPRPPEALAIASELVERPEDTRPLDALAAAAFVSQRTIERQFRAETGFTPHQWRSHNRLARAAELVTSGVDVAVVAAQVGYTDLDAFRRAFTAKFGTTPRRFVLAHASSGAISPPTAPEPGTSSPR